MALRTVLTAPQYYSPEPLAHLGPPSEEKSFLETLRKLWRHRLLIAAYTAVLGGAAITAAWLMPSYYVSEARVLVGVQSPRLPNVESIMADVGPDAERVQNEGLMLQSRNIAKQVIDQLKLKQNPEFNPELAPRSFWSRLDVQQYLPSWVQEWVKPRATKTVEANKTVGKPDDLMIDILLGHVEVSTLGRSHVLSIKAELRDPATAAAIANTMAERYLFAEEPSGFSGLMIP